MSTKTRRISGTGSLFKWLKKNSETGEPEHIGWCAVADLGYGTDGKRKRQAVRGRTQREVVDRLNELLRDHQRGVLPKSGRTTVAQWLTTWLGKVETSVRPRTHEYYRWIVREHLVPTIGLKPLGKLSPSDVEAMLGNRLQAGLSPRTVDHVRAVLRNALRWAERDGLISRNVASLATPPRVPRVEMRTMSPEGVKAFLAALAGHPLEALYITTLGLGLRQGEVLGLRWSDIDLDARRLRVSRALQYIRPVAGGAGVAHLVEPKSGTSRRALDLPEPVVDALRQHRSRWLAEKIRLGPRWLNEWDLVFVGPFGEPLNPRLLLEDFHAVLRGAQLPEIRFHDLRHSCASLLLLAGVPARMVQEILGHSSITLTLGTYSHVLPELREQAVRAQAGILGG